MSAKSMRNRCAGLLLVCTLMLSACTLAHPSDSATEFTGRGPLTVAIHPRSDTPALRAVVTEWNETHSTEYIEIKVLSENPRDRYTQITRLLQKGDEAASVIESDLTWLPELARVGRISALPESRFSLASLFTSTVQASRVSGASGYGVYTVPSAIEASLLYYRSDLLAQAGTHPGNTVEDLQRSCDAVRAQTPEMQCWTLPLSTQEAAARTLTEQYVERGGGLTQLFDATAEEVKNDALSETLTQLTQGVQSGVIAKNSITTDSTENINAFENGEVLYLTGGAKEARLVRDNPETYGVQRTPILSPSGSTLLHARGWVVGTESTHKASAVEFIQEMTNSDTARARATNGVVPALRQAASSNSTDAYVATVNTIANAAATCLTTSLTYPAMLTAVESAAEPLMSLDDR